MRLEIVSVVGFASSAFAFIFDFRNVCEVRVMLKISLIDHGTAVGAAGASLDKNHESRIRQTAF